MRLAAVIALAMLAPAREAAACDCASPELTVSGGRVALGPESTLYVFAPTDVPFETPGVRQGDRALAVDVDEVSTTKAGKVLRLRIHGATPGTKLTVDHGDDHEVVAEPPRRTWPHLRNVAYSGLAGGCETTGASLELAGDRAAAFRLRWKDAAGPREVYLPAEPARDANNIPIRGLQTVHVGFTGCGTRWLELDPAAFAPDAPGVILEGATLTMLGVDGDEVTVLAGDLVLRRDRLSLEQLAQRPPPRVAPPPAALPPPPAAKIVWWRILAGSGGGLTLGALVGWLLLVRRR